MKKLLFALEITMYVVVFAGCLLSLVGSVMLAMDNAMYDYYHNTSRQLTGWFLCFIPAILAALGAAAYFFRRYISWLEVCGIGVIFLAVFIPFIYMATFGTFLTFNFIGLALFFAAAQGALVMTLFDTKKKSRNAAN